MKTTTRPIQRQPGRSVRTGFTLVEMLAVIVVIGILIAIVIGISGMVTDRAAESKTRQWMGIIREAVQVYYDKTGKLPSDEDQGQLYELLVGNAEAEKRLRALPSEATREISEGGEDKTYFFDGFGYEMRYRSTGGAGNTPFLESAGPDHKFGDDEDDKDSKDDNIRSDKL